MWIIPFKKFSRLRVKTTRKQCHIFVKKKEEAEIKPNKKLMLEMTRDFLQNLKNDCEFIGYCQTDCYLYVFITLFGMLNQCGRSEDTIMF